MEPFLKDGIRHNNLWELLNFPQDWGLIPLLELKKPSSHCSLERRQKVVASQSLFQGMDSYCNEHVLVEEILVQVMGHKHGTSCEMLSCAPS